MSLRDNGMNRIVFPEDSLDYAAALRTITAECLARGEMNPEDIIRVLRKLNQFDKVDYTDEQIEEEAYISCQEAGKIQRGRKPIMALVTEYIDSIRSDETEIVFSIRDIYKDLKLETPYDRNACRTVLHRLTGKMVNHNGGRSGSYKVIGLPKLQTIDLWADESRPLKIKYPFGIHELIHTHPKNILIVAGEPNAGKSAYLLNFAQMNMGRDHDVYYFSSEMGALELKARLKKFNLPMDEWKRVNWIERAQDFHEVIQPNAINIIDFLEVHDEFYKIGLMIKQIFDKLEAGIAFIALQKNKGRDEGMGGMRSMEKARLYLAMEPGKLKIVKAKNWRNEEINPNNFTKEFKLVAGCHFKVQKDDKTGKEQDWGTETPAPVSRRF